MAEAGEKKETSKKQSDIPPNFVTLVQLRERWLKKKAEEEEEEERKLKEMQEEEERRRKFEETKQRTKFEAIQRNSESSGHRREIGRPLSDAVTVASAQALREGNEDDEASKREKERKSMSKKKKKKPKKTARAKEKEETMEGKQPFVSVAESTKSESIPVRRPPAGKEAGMEYRPKIKNVEIDISKGDDENECLPSRKRRGKRAANMKFRKNSGNVDEENCKLEIEAAKLAELSIEERKRGLETKNGVADDGLYQTRSRREVNRARHRVDSNRNYEKSLNGPDDQTMYAGMCINGDGELNRSECQDPSDGKFHGSRGREYSGRGSRGRGEGGRGSRGRGDGRRGSKGRGNGGQHGRGNGRCNNAGVWVRRDDVGSGGEVSVNSSGVQSKGTSN